MLCSEWRFVINYLFPCFIKFLPSPVRSGCAFTCKFNIDQFQGMQEVLPVEGHTDASFREKVFEAKRISFILS